jgi:hypothetical protein
MEFNCLSIAKLGGKGALCRYVCMYLCTCVPGAATFGLEVAENWGDIIKHACRYIWFYRKNWILFG